MEPVRTATPSLPPRFQLQEMNFPHDAMILSTGTDEVYLPIPRSI